MAAGSYASLGGRPFWDTLSQRQPRVVVFSASQKHRISRLPCAHITSSSTAGPVSSWTFGARIGAPRSFAEMTGSLAEASVGTATQSNDSPSLPEVEQELAGRTVMVYGLSWSLAPEEAEAWVRKQLALCSKHGFTLVQMKTFDGDIELQSSYPAFSQHAGYAHIALKCAKDLGDVLAHFDAQELDGRPVKALRAKDTKKMLPFRWVETVKYEEGGEVWLQEYEEAQAERKRKHEQQIRHNRNRRRRRQAQHVEALEEVIASLTNPFTGKELTSWPYAPLSATEGSACAPLAGEASQWAETSEWHSMWSRMPAACDPAIGGRLCKKSLKAHASGTKPQEAKAAVEMAPRAERKRVQVATFATILRSILGGRLAEKASSTPKIVDFGCGSGNLVLPLASLFPGCSFIGVDMKPKSVELLNERAKEAGLDNVSGVVGSIEEFSEPFHVALGLHACGKATDYAIAQAVTRQAAYVMCPCCVGKLKLTNAGAFNSQLIVMSADDPQPAVAEVGPNSAWLRESLTGSQFEILATAADMSHTDGHAYSALAEQAKICIELDRNMLAAESGYRTVLTKLIGTGEGEFVNKSDVLVGVPGDSEEGLEFQWPWL